MTRTIIVTGGFGILGTAVSAAFCSMGDKVARVDFAESALDTVAGAIDIGGIDLSDFAGSQVAVQKVIDQVGRPDVLVNIAGGFVWETLAQGGQETWERMFAMNTLTCVNMTKAALPELCKGPSSRIINIGANGAQSADMGMGAYAASKAAVHKLTESLAAELSGQRITINAVLPSIIDTPTNRADMPDADFDSWVRPEAIADTIVFLASPAARAINGALIPVTRGGD